MWLSCLIKTTNMAAFLLSLIFIIEKTMADCGREQIIGGKNRNGEITSPRYRKNLIVHRIKI
jgi:hypothetical protein